MKKILFYLVMAIVAGICVVILLDLFASGMHIMLFGAKLVILPIVVIALLYFGYKIFISRNP
jgi:hypothetical protein